MRRKLSTRAVVETAISLTKDDKKATWERLSRRVKARSLVRVEREDARRVRTNPFL